MNKALPILGGIFLALLVVGGGLIGFAMVKGGALDAESKAYAEATLPRILPNPNAENFRTLMAPQDQAKLSVAAADQFALQVRDRLGRFQSCHDVKGDSFQNYTTGGTSITAKYSARCRFEKGSVTATITLRKTGDAWSLMGVFFDQNSFEPRRDPVRADLAPTPAETYDVSAIFPRSGPFRTVR